MNILIIGAGGREHAIGEKIKFNQKVNKLFFAPGNAGTEKIGSNVALSSIEEMLKFAKKNEIHLTIVGSEELLVNGIVDKFQANNLRIFGPNQAAAQLEGSKAYSKSFMEKYGIRTAKYQSFDNASEALEYLETEHFPIVIKASGLAAGKGVLICPDRQSARDAIQQLMLEKIFGDSGNTIVIEEFLEGKEVSVLSIFNGKTITPFISAKDHKKIGEGETGLNTGGMGVIAPNPYFTKKVAEDFNKNILIPTQKGLMAEQLLFSGIIFFGLMITDNGIYCLEYNLRLGDPETQAVLPLMKSDFLTIIERAIEQKSVEIEWKNAHSCCVVMVSGGYPKEYAKGKKITGINKLSILHYIAGAKSKGGNLVTSGGRVVNIIAIAKTAKKAKSKAYSEIKKVHFGNAYYRRDIG